MKSMMLITTLMMALNTGLANAQIDPDPNSMGVFFDEEGNWFCSGGGGGMEVARAHLLVTRPTADAISGWECRLESTVNAYYPGEWALVHKSDPTIQGPDFDIDLDEPIPVVGTSVILATRDILIFGEPNDGALFFLSGNPNSVFFNNRPGYFDGEGNPIPCVMPNRYDENHSVAQFGCVDFDIWYMCAHGHFIANETMTWGQVKALY